MSTFAENDEIAPLIPQLSTFSRLLRENGAKTLHKPELEFLRNSLVAAGCSLPPAPPEETVDLNAPGTNMTSPNTDRRASYTRAIEAASDVLGEGCYLTTEDVSAGTVYLNWSKTPVNGAIAVCKPGKPVGAFKFKSNGGKSELKRGVRGPLVKNLYQAICSFVKLCKENAGSFTLLFDEEHLCRFQVLLHTDVNITKVGLGVTYDMSAVEAVAVLPRDSSALDCPTLPRGMFMQKGLDGGASLELK